MNEDYLKKETEELLRDVLKIAKRLRKLLEDMEKNG